MTSNGNSNIKVAIRVRPLISREKSDKLKEQWEVNENSIYPIDVATGKRNGEVYHFDHIFGSTCCNADIYDTVVHPVVDKAVNGFNGTIFAYGQTSSGKTFTMMGNSAEDGIISKAVENIFLGIEQSVNRKFLLRVSYLEIYNEKLYDLLDVKNIVKISEDYNGSVIVNVKEEVTDCADKVYDIMRKGDKARRIGETNMNEKSSRSHTIFRIIIESSDITDMGVVNVAHLNLVDLAGSERATLTKATGQRLKEGAHINKSLSTLSLVMKQLSESQDFINFRDSKLTRILQPSLGGNALTAIICAVTPAALEETHSTLAFASRAKTVKNKPFVNEIVTDEALINRYALEIDKLKRDLEVANDKRNLQAEKIAVLQKCILISKKTNTMNIKRRKTWSAPHDSNKTLPIIYETDVLRLSDNLNFDDTINTITSLQNLQTERCSVVDDYSSEANNSLFSEIKQLQPCTILPCLEDIIPELIQASETDQSPTKICEDVVHWLVNSTETPKSVHKERADYYEREFNSLKEITTKEKLLLTDENICEMDKLKLELDQVKNELEYERKAETISEMDKLKLELDQVKNELECEKKLKKEREHSFANEKKILNTKIEELNASFSKLVQNKEKEAKNDCEFLAEMYKEKYKKREKELLDSLKEARDKLKSNTNNTDDEKTLEISTDFSSINEFLEKCKHHLHILKSELASNLSVSTVQKLFDEIKKLNEDVLNNSTDCTEEIQEFLNVFNYMFDLASIVLCDDTLISEIVKEKQKLENRVSYFENKEKTYELLVSKQDEEIQHLSNNILQYMNELDFYKSEVTKYKDMAMNSSVTVCDTKNTTVLENSSHNDNQKAEIASYIKKEKKLLAIIQSKDKEIEDLSDKIMEYIEQLTSIEQEFSKSKSVFEADQTDLISKYEAKIGVKNKLLSEKDNFIEELKNEKENLQSEVKILKVQVENEKILLTDQKTSMTDVHFRVTEEIIKNKNSENTVNNSDLIMKTNQYIQTEEHFPILIQIQEKDENEKNNIKMQEENDQIQIEKQQITDLSCQIVNFTENLAVLDNTLEKYKSDTDIHKDLIKENDQEIKINTTIENDILVVKNKEIEKSSAIIDLNIQNDLFQDKNNEIKESSTNIVGYKNNLSIEEKVHEYIPNLKVREDLTESENKVVENLSSNINYENEEIAELSSNVECKINLSLTEELNKYKSDLKICEDLIELKNKEIEELSLNVVFYKNSLSSNEEEMNKYKCDSKINEDLMKSKNKEIEELSSNVVVYKNNLSSTKEQVSKYKSDIKVLNDLIETKNKEIEEISSIVVDNRSNLLSYEEKINEFKSALKINEDLIKSKNEEIAALSSNVSECKINLSLTEELNKYKSDLKIREDLIELKNKEIEELSLNVVFYKNSLLSNEDEINKYKSDIKILKDLIETKNKEIEELTSNVVGFKNNLSSTEEEVNKYKSDITILKDLIETKNKEIEELTSNVVGFKNNLPSSEEEVNKYKSDITILKDLIETKNKEIEELTSNVVGYKNNLSSSEEEVNKYKSDITILKDLIETKNKEIEKLTSNVVGYKNNLSSTEEEVNKYKSDITILKDLIETKNKEIEELTSNVVGYKNNLSSSEEEVNKYKSDITILKDLIETKNKEIEMLTSNVVGYKNNLSSTEEEVNKYKSDINILQELIETKNKEIEELTSNVVCYKNNLSSSEEEVNKYKSDITILKDLIETKNKEIEKLTSNVVGYKNNLLSTEEEVNKYKFDIKILNDLIDTKYKEIEEMSSIIADNKSNLLSYEEMINKYKSDLKINEDLIKSKNKEIAELSSNLIECKNNLSSTGEELNKYKSYLRIREDLIEEFLSTIADYINNLSSIEKALFKYQKEKDTIHSSNSQILKLCDTSKLLLKDNKLDYLKQHLEIIQNIINLKNNEIEKITKLSDELGNKQNKEINALQIKLSTKEECIVFMQTEIENLNKIINQRTRDLQELNEKKIIETMNNSSQSESLEELKKCLLKSETEKWNSKIRFEKTKILQYLQTIKDLEEQLGSLSEELVQMRQKNESTQNTNLQNTKMHENLKKQICDFQNQLTEKDRTLKQFKDYICQLEQDNAKMLETNTLLRDASSLEIRETEEKSKYIENMQKEVVNLQNQNSNLVDNIAKLKKRNEEYKKEAKHVTEQANFKITSCNNILVKLRKENEYLKMQVDQEKKTNQTLQHNQLALREELERKKSEFNSSGDFITLHDKITNLESHNKKIVKIMEDYQEQLCEKKYECKTLEKNLETLKKENASLQIITKDLNSKIRDAEGALEDVKFELYTLKNKEREKIIKIKRQSLHDSSRTFSSDEHAEVIDENQLTPHQSYDYNKPVGSRSHETEKKERLPLASKQLNEHDERLSKIQMENEKLRKKNDQLISLCRVRKQRIDELTRKSE